LQNAETGTIFTQKEIQAIGPGGGCLEMAVDGNGLVSIDDQPTISSLDPAEHTEILGVLIPLFSVSGFSLAG
jgi:hypothetical protein